MDDVLPLSIYIISQVNIKNIGTEFNIIEDFIKINEERGKSGFEHEKRLLTNFNGGIDYIMKEWAPPSPPDSGRELVDGSGTGTVLITSDEEDGSEQEQF